MYVYIFFSFYEESRSKQNWYSEIGVTIPQIRVMKMHYHHKRALTKCKILYVRASQTLLFCDPILEKKFLRDPWMNSLHVNDIKAINVPLQAMACFVLRGERGAKH